MSYEVETAGSTIGSYCFVDSYRGVIALSTPQTEQDFGAACSSALGRTIEINIDEETSLYSATVKVTSNTVSYSVLNSPGLYLQMCFSKVCLLVLDIYVY